MVWSCVILWFSTIFGTAYPSTINIDGHENREPDRVVWFISVNHLQYGLHSGVYKKWVGRWGYITNVFFMSLSLFLHGLKLEG